MMIFGPLFAGFFLIQPNRSTFKDKENVFGQATRP